MSKFIVKVSAAPMPSNCWGRYVRVGVLEVEEGVASVPMISTHARGVLRIVRTWEKCHVGITARSASAKAIAEANALAEVLNFTRAVA